MCPLFDPLARPHTGGSSAPSRRLTRVGILVTKQEEKPSTPETHQ